MHAWVDPDGDPEAKSSYKFPHHDVSENGEVGAANLRGVAAAIAALNGARGGAAIPSSDRREVYRHLAAHYADADLDAPPLQESSSIETRFIGQLKMLEGQEGTLQGIASVYDSIDMVGDRIKKGAFKKTISENPTVPVLWQHEPSQVIGVAKVTDTGKRIIADITLDMQDQLAQSALRKVKMGLVKGLSIGFTPVKVSWVEEGDLLIREINELRLWEVSLVTFPALPEAQVVSAKMVFRRPGDAENATPEMAGAGEEQVEQRTEEPEAASTPEVEEIISTLRSLKWKHSRNSNPNSLTSSPPLQAVSTTKTAN
jgi:HK97 family phage prohead protease